MNDVEIRWAVYRDWNDLALIHSQAYRSAYKGMIPDEFLDQYTVENQSNHFQKSLNEGLDNHALLIVNNRAIGYMTIGKCQDEDVDSTFCEIISLYLLNEFIGKGFGITLISFGLARIKELGYSNVSLWVLQENANARRFYEKLGFNHDGAERVIIRGKELVQLRYQKRICGK
jgi:ribosomal protein S18 acetylase RimI-like enzyme